MKRIEAERLVAHAVVCEGCDAMIPVRGPASRPPGFYVTVERVTDARNRSRTEEMFFHEKDCMLNTLRYGLNHGRLRALDGKAVE